MNETPAAGAVMNVSPGATLARAREASGLSIADVAGEMRISPRQVQAIEADQYEQLPGAVFVRGFIRNYARLLGLDPNPLLGALQPELAQEVPLRAHEISGTLPVPARRHHPRIWTGVFTVVFAAAVAAGAYELWHARTERLDIPTKAPPQAPDSGADSASAPAAGPDVAAPFESIALTPETLPNAPETSGATPGSLQPPRPAVQTPAAKADDSVHAARIGIEFARESWVEIRDGEGKVVFSGTGQPNTARSLEAVTPVDVVIGNASGVRITYNEAPFDVASHAAGNIARFKLE